MGQAAVLLLPLLQVLLQACTGPAAAETEIVSSFERTRVVRADDGTSKLLQDQVVNVQCATGKEYSEVFQELERPDGETMKIRIRCQPVHYDYRQTLLGYVPANGIFSEASVCLAQGSAPSDSASSPSALRVGSAHRRASPMFSFGGVASAGLGAIGKGANFGRGTTCSFTGFGCGGGGNIEVPECEDCVKEEEFNDAIKDLEDAQAGFGSQLESFLGNMTDLERRQNDLAETIVRAGNETAKSVAMLVDATERNAAVSERMNAAMEEMADDLGHKLSATDARIDDVIATTQELAQLAEDNAGEMQASLQRFANKTARNFEAVSDAMKAESLSVRKGLERASATQARTARALSRLLTSLERARLRTQERAALTAVVQSMIDEVRLDDAEYIPFLASEGEAPQPDAATLPLVRVDETRIRAVAAGEAAAAPRAHEWTLSYQCSTGWLVRNGVAVFTAQRAMEYMRSAQACDPSTEASRRQTCQCWVLAKHISCDASAFLLEQRSTPWTAFQSKTEALDLLAASEGVCNGALQRHADRIISGPDFTLGQYFSGQGQGLKSDAILRTLYEEPVSGLGHRYQVLNLQPIARASTAEAAPHLVAEWSLERALNPEAEDTTNPLWAYMRILDLSYQMNWQNLEWARRIVVGSLPAGLHTRTDEYAVTEAGQPASCTYSSFMSFVNETLPLVRLDITSRAASVKAWATCCKSNDYSGEEYELDSEVASLLSVENEAMLPGSGYLTVGDITSTDAIYNVPQDDISAAPSPASRAGTVSYVVAADPAQVYNFSAWSDANGQRFQPSDAAAVAALYEVPVTAFNNSRKCEGERPAGSAGPCGLLDAFSITEQPVDDSGPPLLRFRPRKATYRATLVLPQGDVTQALVAGKASSCPAASFTDSTAMGRSLALQAPLSNSGLVGYRLRLSRGACGASEAEFALQPGGLHEEWIPHCAANGAADASLQTAAVDFLRADGGYEPCGSPLQVGTNATFYSEVVGLADAGHVRRSVATERDYTTVLVSEVSADLVAMQAQALTGQVKSLLQLGVPLEASQVDGMFSGLEETVARLQAQLANNTRGNETYAWENNEAFEQNRAELQRVNETLSEARATALGAQAFYANASAEVGAMRREFDRIDNATRELVAAWDDVRNATSVVSDHTVRQFANLEMMIRNATISPEFGTPDLGFITDHVSVQDLANGMGAAVSLAEEHLPDIVAGGLGIAKGTWDVAEGAGSAALSAGRGLRDVLKDDILGAVLDEIPNPLSPFSNFFESIQQALFNVMLVVAFVGVLWMVGRPLVARCLGARQDKVIVTGAFGEAELLRLLRSIEATKIQEAIGATTHAAPSAPPRSQEGVRGSGGWRYDRLATST